jgi:cyanate lyase
MPKAEAADLIVAARIRKKLMWADIDAPLVWWVAALLGQHLVYKSHFAD